MSDTSRDASNPGEQQLAGVPASYAKDDSALFSDKPVSDLRHILMPCMAWACGGDIVTKGGHILFLNEWDKVTCPDCLALGRDVISAETKRQQGRS